jgi:hypothetical protein
MTPPSDGHCSFPPTRRRGTPLRRRRWALSLRLSGLCALVASGSSLPSPSHPLNLRRTAALVGAAGASAGRAVPGAAVPSGAQDLVGRARTAPGQAGGGRGRGAASGLPRYPGCAGRHGRHDPRVRRLLSSGEVPNQDSVDLSRRTAPGLAITRRVPPNKLNKSEPFDYTS